MNKKLKNYNVLVKALDNFSLVSLDINVLNKKGENVFKKVKESMASGLPNHYLSFIEEKGEPFTLRTNNTSKNWDGTLEYSTDAQNWNEWNGTEISSSNDGKLYLRGKDNTKITDYNKQFVLTSDKRIKCQGNIENLLDYETVKQGSHPAMADACYKSMFNGCASLTTAPELPATTLADNCYFGMFEGCTSLTVAPKLPATTLTYRCYYSMFSYCSSLTQASELPAASLADECYYNMFYGCTSLTKAPELPATTLAKHCYYFMFSRCTSLTKAPELPATTLAYGCYQGMFYNCPSLIETPELPAIVLADNCYLRMFEGCTSLIKAPNLPATTLADDCYSRMFEDCTSLAGTIHCPASTASNTQRLDAKASIPANTATVVYDL